MREIFERLNRKVLVMDGECNLQWSSLHIVVKTAQAYDRTIVCHTSAIVGHYITLEKR